MQIKGRKSTQGLRCLPHEPHVKEGPRGLQTKWHLGAFVEEMMVP